MATRAQQSRLRRCASSGTRLAARIALRAGGLLERVHLSAPQLLSVIGRFAATAGDLRERDDLDSEAFAKRLISDATIRKLVLSGGSGVPTSELFNLAADATLGPTASAQLRSRPSADLAKLTYTALVLDPVSAGMAGITASLRLMPAGAPAFTEAQAQSVLARLLTRARQELDPYSSDNTPILLARSALVELLVARPELDKQMLSEIAKETAPPLPVTAELLAAAIRRRAGDGGQALATVLRAWSPGRDMTVAFARYVDNTFPRATESRRRHGHWRVADLVLTAGVRIAIILSGPAIGLAAMSYTYAQDWRRPSVSIGFADALAAFALLATVSVFTVQLSATRLKGPVARVAGLPRMLEVAYSLTITLILLALMNPHHQLRAAARWAEIAILCAFVASLVIALLTIARRTDAAQAARAYRRTTMSDHARAGHRLGKFQARSAEVRGSARDLPGIVLAFSGERVGTRIPVTAKKRGFLLPKLEELRRIATTPEVAGGEVILRIAGGIGTIVEQGQLLATLMPRHDVVVSRRIERLTSRALRVRGVRRVDDTTSASVALVALAWELADTADYATARLVAQESALLVADHVRAVREERRRLLRRQLKRAQQVEAAQHPLRAGVKVSAAALRSRDRDLAPVVPALRAVVLATTSRALRTDHELFDIPELVLETLLSACGPAEAGASILLGAIPSNPEAIVGHPSTVGLLMTMATVRAMETDDAPAIALARERIERLGTGRLRSEMLRVASDLTSMCCWILPLRAEEQFEWYLRLINGAASHKPLGLARVGAAALLAGTPSVAVASVLTLHDDQVDLASARQAVLNDDVRMREDFQSRIRGGYLGDSPSDAFANFFDFADAVYAAV